MSTTAEAPPTEREQRIANLYELVHLLDTYDDLYIPTVTISVTVHPTPTIMLSRFVAALGEPIYTPGHATGAAYALEYAVWPSVCLVIPEGCRPDGAL